MHFSAFSIAAGAAGDVSSSAHVSADSTAARSAARQAQNQVRVLEANLAKALLINEALWELIRDKLKLTEEDLNNKLYEIDMRDGVLDGKNQRPVSECRDCNRKVSSRHPACLYCGAVMDDSVFKMT
ncbi:MAG: hypothetical protein GY869_02325 [Planctomycetes bacterium]|nr:hypothetical protein [Planctomycetota bacterium]